MFRDSIIAAIRTAVAALIGTVITFLLAQGFELPEEFKANFTMVVLVLVIGGYNWLVAFLERKVHPYFGILLGIPKAPAYGTVGTSTPPASPKAVDEALDYVSPATRTRVVPAASQPLKGQ